MGVILQFLATNGDTEDETEVASISINSLAAGRVFQALAGSPLEGLAGDTDVPRRIVRLPRPTYPSLVELAARLREETPPGDVLRDLANAIDDAVEEAAWRHADLLVVAS